MIDKRAIFDKAFLNVLSYLESEKECQNIEFQVGDSVSAHELAGWDRTNAPFQLPTDVKRFYSLFNGIDVTWQTEIGDKVIQMGEIKVPKLKELQRVSIVDCICDFNNWKDVTVQPPTDFKTCGAFTVESCDSGDVILLFDESQKVSGGETGGSQSSGSSCSPIVCLMDRCGRLHYICQSFRQYLRLMVLHLGIRGWQLAFTPEGLPPATQQWMNYFCKERLITDLYSNDVLLRDK